MAILGSFRGGSEVAFVTSVFFALSSVTYCTRPRDSYFNILQESRARAHLRKDNETEKRDDEQDARADLICVVADYSIRRFWLGLPVRPRALAVRA